MPKVYHVKKARKDNPAVKKGEPYYWWKHAFGPKQFSKTYPKRSQLTQSSFLSTIYDLEDNLETGFNDFDNLSDDIQALVDELENLKDECQDSLDNMPEHLQDTSTAGETLQERIDELESAIYELEGIASDIPEYDPDDDPDDSEDDWKDAQFDDLFQRIQDAFPQV